MGKLDIARLQQNAQLHISGKDTSVGFTWKQQGRQLNSFPTENMLYFL